MPFTLEQFADKYRYVWRDPPATEAYARARMANYGPAALATLGTPGVPGLSYGRYDGPVWSPWLWTVPNYNLAPAYTTPYTPVLPRGLSPQTGTGLGTPAARPGAGQGLIEVAPGEFI